MLQVPYWHILSMAPVPHMGKDATSCPFERGQKHSCHAGSLGGERLTVFTYSKSMDRSGKVANPTRGQLSRKTNLSISLFAPENLVSRNGFNRTIRDSLFFFRAQAESGAYSRDWSRLPWPRPLIYTAIRHRVSPNFIGSRTCVPMTFTAESPPAQGHQ